MFNDRFARLGGAGGRVLVGLAAVGFLAGPSTAQENSATTHAEVTVYNLSHELDSNTGAELHANSALINGPTYGMTGFVDSIVRPNHSVGVRGQMNDPMVDYYAISGHGHAYSHLVIHVDAPGTIQIPLVSEGTLSIPPIAGSAGGRDYLSGSTLQFYVQERDQYGWHILNSADSLSCDIAKFRKAIYGENTYTKTVGLEAGEYTATDTALAWSIDRVMTASFPAEGDYDIVLKIGLQASAHAYGDTGGAVTLDAYNSLGFGGDFWQVVSGDTTFYEIDNPSNHYLPEPTTLTMLALVFAMSLKRRHFYFFNI